MDIKDCVNILNERSIALQGNEHNCTQPLSKSISCFECNQSVLQKPSAALDETTINDSLSTLNGLSDLDLANLFTALQGERVQIYQEYDKAFQSLITNEDLASYPLLCAEITSLFIVISKKIINVKEIFSERNMKELSQLVDGIQSLEREKLTLTAAKHLEILRIAFPHMQSQYGPIVEGHDRVLADKLIELQSKICDHMENFQSLKCDML